MSRIIWVILSLLAISKGFSENLVPGFERFHSKEVSFEGGALLYSELGCINCHGGESGVATPRMGASLKSLSSRVNRDWVVKFLKEPNAGRSGSSMPNLVHDLSEEEIDSIVSYLGSLGPNLKLKPSRHANAERGSAVYHEVGCASCHGPTSDYRGPQGEITEIASWAVKFPDFKQKTGLTELNHFLTAASSYRQDGRMPHFNLSKEDAIDLSAHLMDFQASDPREAKQVEPWPKPSQDAIAKGKALFIRKKCNACHKDDSKGSELFDPTGYGLRPNRVGSGQNCLSDSPGIDLPRYSLTDHQKASLTKFLSEENSIKENEAHLTLAAMNCYACHSRDGLGGVSKETNSFFVGEESLGDSGRLAPPLSGIGHKLKSDWLIGVLEGKNRVRPYLKTRMPNYSQQASVLADCFEKWDAGTKQTKLIVDSKHIESGKKLLGINGGVNCVTCHNWGNKTSPGIPGLDISGLDKRLKPEWFREYLLNPAAYRPGTLMPPLWPEGRSSVKSILGGDTEKQIAAIWAFISEGEGVPEGYRESDGKFELVPKDRPIIQRAFFEKASGKAILVGFPGEIHLAFNGETGAPALIWKGRFFNAYETWFLRKAEFQKPLSDEFAVFESPEKQSRFRGYETDSQGNPIFHLVHNGTSYTEHYEVKDGKLWRTITLGEGDAPAFYHPKEIEREDVVNTSNTQTYTYSWK